MRLFSVLVLLSLTIYLGSRTENYSYGKNCPEEDLPAPPILDEGYTYIYPVLTKAGAAYVINNGARFTVEKMYTPKGFTPKSGEQTPVFAYCKYYTSDAELRATVSLAKNVTKCVRVLDNTGSEPWVYWYAFGEVKQAYNGEFTDWWDLRSFTMQPDVLYSDVATDPAPGEMPWVNSSFNPTNANITFTIYDLQAFTP